MTNQYEKVPFILSSKDLEYLKDMFSWNYGAYKANLNAKNNIKSVELSETINKAVNTFYQTMNQILNILSEGESNG